MGSPIKKLAGETAIYGLSTILARIINFFFVPIYTRILTTDGYGAYSEIMSYIAVLQVVLVLGLETGCFKFASHAEHPEKPFSTALITVTTVVTFFFICMLLFASPIAGAMGYPGYGKMIIYIGGILAFDSVTAIFFARLRYLQKAFKFAIYKTIKILTELGANLMLFFWVPAYFAKHPQSLLGQLIPTTVDFSYIIFAVFVSCVVCFILFIPDMIKMRLKFNWDLWKKMMIYSLPLMVAGLPGIINESLDRILFRFFVGPQWRADLGVYQAAVKLAVIMNLFIQMFRYAAEPFFFAKVKEKGSNELYAKIMEYFIAFCMLIFLGVTLYIDIIGLILGKDFRGAMNTVPFMLFAYMTLGAIFNVSMWYKLSGQTRFAINITVVGLLVTAVVNIIFMPLFSYWASVAAHVLSCLAMLIYSIYLGNKYYPIPYNWKKITSYVGVAVGIYIVSLGLRYIIELTIGEKAKTARMAMTLAINTVLNLSYIWYCIKKENLQLYFIK